MAFLNLQQQGHLGHGEYILLDHGHVGGDRLHVGQHARTRLGGHINNSLFYINFGRRVGGLNAKTKTQSITILTCSTATTLGEAPKADLRAASTLDMVALQVQVTW